MRRQKFIFIKKFYDHSIKRKSTLHNEGSKAKRVYLILILLHIRQSPFYVAGYVAQKCGCGYVKQKEELP